MECCLIVHMIKLCTIKCSHSSCALVLIEVIRFSTNFMLGRTAEFKDNEYKNACSALTKFALTFFEELEYL